METDLAAAFGKVLRARRTAAGLSQQDLAFEAGLDRTYVSLLERGLRQPTLTTLFCLSSSLGAEPEVLVAQVRQRLAG